MASKILDIRESDSKETKNEEVSVINIFENHCNLVKNMTKRNILTKLLVTKAITAIGRIMERGIRPDPNIYKFSNYKCFHPTLKSRR